VSRLRSLAGTDSEHADTRLASDETAFTGQVLVRLWDGCECLMSVSPKNNPLESFPDSYELAAVLTDVSAINTAEANRVLGCVEHLPFTALELKEIESQLPLSLGIGDMVQGRPLSGVAMFLTIHHMTDFVGMVEGLKQLGADPGTITVLDKEYRYVLTKRVDATLKHTLGLRVYRYSQLKEAIAAHLDAAKKAGKPTLIIDDGGYVLPTVVKEFSHELPRFVGLVEQTISGINKIRPLEPLPVPVFSVAESNLKATIESYGVADASVRSIISLLPHEKFEGQPALVVGYGRIGQEVANILRARRMRVAVYDKELVRIVAAHERGFATDTDLGRLVAQHRPFLIVGSAGANSMMGPHFARIRRDCFLASVTSRNYEFAIHELAYISDNVEDDGKLGSTYTLGNGSRATVLAHGYPINFHYAESMPNKYADLVLASLMVGACTLASPGNGFAAGHNLDRTNVVLESSPLLERYYQLYGPTQYEPEPS
jgi:S-adenosylhomocysteine hydrolase